MSETSALQLLMYTNYTVLQFEIVKNLLPPFKMVVSLSDGPAEILPVKVDVDSAHLCVQLCREQALLCSLKNFLYFIVH